jgi:hypothetical protein
MMPKYSAASDLGSPVHCTMAIISRKSFFGHTDYSAISASTTSPVSDL